MPATLEQIAKQFGCTSEQVRQQFARNARSLATMADKAKQRGRKVNGYTASELSAMARKMKRRSRES